MGRAGSEQINPALERRGIELPYSAYPQTVTTRLQRRRRDLRNDTRLRVAELFKPLVRQGQGIDWIMYDVAPPPRQEPEVEGYPDYDATSEIIIIRDTRKASQEPNIRIFATDYVVSEGLAAGETNEDSEEDGEFEGISGNIIRDFTLSPAGVAYCALVGTFDSVDSPSLRYAPLFYVEHPENNPHDNYLVVPHYRSVSRRYSMQTHVRYQRDIHPFGFRRNLLDQIDALTAAQAILAEAEYALQPYLWGTQAII